MNSITNVYMYESVGPGVWCVFAYKNYKSIPYYKSITDMSHIIGINLSPHIGHYDPQKESIFCILSPHGMNTKCTIVRNPIHVTYQCKL